MAVTLRYFTEFGKHAFQRITTSISGWIYLFIYLICNRILVTGTLWSMWSLDSGHARFDIKLILSISRRDLSRRMHVAPIRRFFSAKSHNVSWVIDISTKFSRPFFPWRFVRPCNSYTLRDQPTSNFREIISQSSKYFSDFTYFGIREPQGRLSRKSKQNFALFDFL